MILVDTHVLVWQEQGERRIGPHTRRVLERAIQEEALAVSAISFWELGMRVQKGQLDFRLDLTAWRRDLMRQGLVEVPVNGEIAVSASLLRHIHGDPADRIIVATALEGHTLVTGDRSILDWSGDLSRLDART